MVGPPVGGYSVARRLGRCSAAPVLATSRAAIAPARSTAPSRLLRRTFLEAHPLVGNPLALALAIGTAARLRVEDLLDRAPVALFAQIVALLVDQLVQRTPRRGLRLSQRP